MRWGGGRKGRVGGMSSYGDSAEVLTPLSIHAGHRSPAHRHRGNTGMPLPRHCPLGVPPSRLSSLPRLSSQHGACPSWVLARIPWQPPTF